MVSHRGLAVLGLAIAVAVIFPGQGRTQAADASPAQEAQESRPTTERDLDNLFFDVLPFAALAGVVSGFVMGPSLRALRHHQSVNFPSRIRRLALVSGGILTVACEAVYVGAGIWRQIPLIPLVTHGESTLIPVLFAVLWYVTAYVAVRVPRWSGRYALWPHLKGGRS
jgi:hypothetical protein